MRADCYGRAVNAADWMRNALALHDDAEQARQLARATGGDEDRAAIVAQGAVGGGPTAYGVVYDVDDLAGTWGIVAQAYGGYASLPLPSTRATGCGALGIALGEVPALGATLHFTQTDNGPLTGFLFAGNLKHTQNPG